MVGPITLRESYVGESGKSMKTSRLSRAARSQLARNAHGTQNPPKRRKKSAKLCNRLFTAVENLARIHAPIWVGFNHCSPWRQNVFEGLFQPLHVVVILLVAVLSYGMPFLAGYFLGRYLEISKLKGLTETMTCLIATRLKQE